MYIAVDFDGTIVKHMYPEIGDPVPHAVETIKELAEQGHKIILLTMRGTKPFIENKIDDETGDVIEIIERNTLQEAIDYCKNVGIPLYAVNSNPAQKHWTNSNKVYAHAYIDDAAIGCPLIEDNGKRTYVDWLKVKELLSPQEK